MQHRPAAPTPAQEWDEQLLGWSRAHLLQSWGWGELQAGAGWDVERLRIPVDGRDLPVTVLRGGAGLRGLPPRLYVPKGPASAPADATAWRAVLGAIDECAASAAASTVSVEPNAWYDERALLQEQLGAGWAEAATVQPQHTAVVDLRGGEDAVLARMKPKGRYNIRLAAKKGVVVEKPRDPALAAAELAGLCAATAARQGINLPGAAYFERALRCLPSARVLIARVDGEAVSGVLVAHFAGEMIYLYGGSTTRHRERQPSSALHFQVIREAIAAGCDRYDLWGIPPSDDPGHAWHGLRQFKLALGGAERSSAGAFAAVRRPGAARAAAAANAARRGVRRVKGLLRSRAGSHSAVQSRPTMEPPVDS